MILPLLVLLLLLLASILVAVVGLYRLRRDFYIVELRSVQDKGVERFSNWHDPNGLTHQRQDTRITFGRNVITIVAGKETTPIADRGLTAFDDFSAAECYFRWLDALMTHGRTWPVAVGRSCYVWVVRERSPQRAVRALMGGHPGARVLARTSFEAILKQGRHNL